MNKVLLALNALILIVNFVLTFASSGSQIGVLQATARAGNTMRRGGVPDSDPALSYMRLVQSLGGSIPRERLDKLTTDQMRTIYDATSYYRATVDQGVSRILASDSETPILRRHEELSKSAREEVEMVLRGTITDDFLVRQITTAIINHAG